MTKTALEAKTLSSRRKSGERGNLVKDIASRLEAAKTEPSPPGTYRASNGVTLACGVRGRGDAAAQRSDTVSLDFMEERE